MTEINVEKLKPVGEFGSKIWCETVANYGVQLLESGDLPRGLEWGFTENYTHPPRRLLDSGRSLSAYFIMVKDGKISGGDGIPPECLALPGFHVEIQWASICNQSRSLYGREGQQQRSAEERIMFRDIAAYTERDNPLGLKRGSKPAVWPKEVASALGKGSEQGGGLHNIAARLQAPSPEFSDLPVTKMGVPDFASMSKEQKEFFLELCGVQV
ncbi:MAG: hypothetical protein OXG08_07580 [Gammaproteobacteria bacterium]|nr:hypothetical protein [Gammaproteobacteria bacterium]